MSSSRGGGGIFISYRREDTAAYAGRLHDRLSDRFGKDLVLMDTEFIEIGANFTRAIIAAVSRCDTLLVLIGRNWLAVADDRGRRRIDNPDDLLRVEIEIALQRDIRVVPILVDGAVLPRASDLPSKLQPLRGRQTFPLSHTGFEFEISRLIEGLQVSVTGRGKWRLELVADEGANKKTFRLSSDREFHDISVKVGGWRGTISVDGIVVVDESGGLKTKEYPLRALSLKFRSDVYIKVDFNRWTPGFRSIVLTVGDQILTCGSGTR